MYIGYTRVSKEDQNLDLQIEALERMGCKKIYQDQITGLRADRPGLGYPAYLDQSGNGVVNAVLKDE